MQGIMSAPGHAEPDEDQMGGPSDADADNMGKAMPDDDESGGDDNPALQAAMEVVMQALYKNGGAKDVAKAMQGNDPAKGLADISYQIVQVADERTNGEVPDDLLATLATSVVTEVAEVAEAAGIKVDGQVVSKAMQLMIVRFLQDQGVDPSQIQQQMAALDQQGNVGQALDMASAQEE